MEEHEISMNQTGDKSVMIWDLIEGNPLDSFS